MWTITLLVMIKARNSKEKT